MINISISKKEWRWVSLWALLIMIITSLPYLYGFLLSTPEQQFSGFVLGVEDGNSYLAKMRLGADRGWLFYLPYTPEPHQGAYIYIFYLLLGKINAGLPVSAPFIYHLARFIFGLGLLYAIYYFIVHFDKNIPRRRFAFLLVAFGSGLGWLLISLGLTSRFGLPLDVYVPEGFIFLLLLNLPHLALAESLLFLALLLTWRSWMNDAWGPAVGAGVALLIMSLMASFYLAVFAATLGGFWLVLFINKQPGLWPVLPKISLPLFIAAPVPLYQIYVFISNPVFRVWGQQNIILSPPIWHYLLAYGLLILPAIYGGRHWLTNVQTPAARRNALFLIVWCVIFPALVYLPFNLQRRLVVGVQVPLAILATRGLFRFYEQRLATSRQTIAQIGTLFFFSLTNLLILTGAFLTLSGRGQPVFQPTTTIEAMQWLADQTEGDIVLATYDTGNLLPVYANVRTFVGHGPETVNSEVKRAQALRFFSNGVDDAWRRDLLTEFNIAYVYYGPAEQVTGDFAPDQAPYLEKIYDNKGVQIFKVKRDEG